MEHMKQQHLPSLLGRLLDAIEESGEGLSWSPYREACAQYSGYGLEMPDDLAEFYLQAIMIRWKREGCELPISL